MEFLKKYNFKSYRLENLSFTEQINLFKNSKMILSAHGAGLANLAFCSKNTKVIEIRPDHHPNKVYERISKINNLNYELYSTPKPNNSNVNGEIEVDLNILKNLID